MQTGGAFKIHISMKMQISTPSQKNSSTQPRIGCEGVGDSVAQD